MTETSKIGQRQSGPPMRAGGNRHQRRANCKTQGVSWRKHREAERFVRQAQEMEAKGLQMTSEQAREALGRWAAVGGEIPEID